MPTPDTRAPAMHISRQLADLFSQGGTLGAAQNYDDADYETLYTLGHRLYGQARYQDAVRVFGFLVLHNHLENRYTTAYASSLQMVARYPEAIQYYSMASLLDINDPLPTFHTAECLLAMGLVAEAKEALGFVLEQSDAPQYAELKTQAEAMLALLDQPGAKP